jgi:hypothetical protein
MFKIFINLSLIFLLTYCASIAGGMVSGALSKGKAGSGAQFYKYRCEKPDQCCEVGKDCEEDIKKKDEVKK